MTSATAAPSLITTHGTSRAPLYPQEQPLTIEVRGSFAPIFAKIVPPQGDSISLQEICNQVLTEHGIDPAEFTINFLAPDSYAYGRQSRSIDLSTNLKDLNRARWSYFPQIRISKKIPSLLSIPGFPKKTALLTFLVLFILGIIALINTDIYTFSIKGMPLSAAVGGVFALLIVGAWLHYYRKRRGAQQALALYRASYPARTARLDKLARSIIDSFAFNIQEVVEARDGSYLSTQEAYYHGTTDGQFSTTAEGFQLSHLGSGAGAGELVFGQGAYFAYSRGLAERYTYNRFYLQGSHLPAPSGAVISAKLAPRRVALITDFALWESVRERLIAHIKSFGERHPCHADIYNAEGDHDIFSRPLWNVIVRTLFIKAGFDAVVLPSPNPRARDIICTGASDGLDGRTVVMFHPQPASGQVQIVASTTPPQICFEALT